MSSLTLAEDVSDVDETKIVDRITKPLNPNRSFCRHSMLDHHPMTLDLWSDLLGHHELPLYVAEDEPFHTLERIYSYPALYPSLRDFPLDYYPGVTVKDHMLYNMARRNNVPYSLYSQPHFLYAIRESPHPDYATLFITFYHPVGTSYKIYAFTESILACPRRYMWTLHILNKTIRRYTAAFKDEQFWILTQELRKPDGSVHKGCLAVLLGYLLLLREHFVSELWKASRFLMVPPDWRCEAFDEYTSRAMLYMETHCLEDRQRIMGIVGYLGESLEHNMLNLIQIHQKTFDKAMSVYNQLHLFWSDGYLGEEPLYAEDLNNLCDIEITTLLQDVYDKDVPSTEQLLPTLVRPCRPSPRKRVYVEILRRKMDVVHNQTR